MAVTLADLIGTVSPSKLDTAQQCLARFCFDYVEKRPRTFRADAQFGTAIDVTASTFYDLKRKHRRAPKLGAVLEFFAATWDYEAGAVDDWQGTKKEALQERGLSLLRVWYEHIAARIGLSIFVLLFVLKRTAKK